MPDDEKANSTQRLEALSDGVFAVAMTLLVLDIKVPEPGWCNSAWPCWGWFRTSWVSS